MLPIKTILHPTDFSASAEFAFRVACSLARDYGARLVLLHVIAPPPVGNFGGMPVVPPPPPELGRKEWEANLRRLQPADVTIPVEYELQDGDAATEIIRAAESIPCELIVMGTHGRGALGRLLMGSVAEQVVRKAPCPVLTVKTPAGETAAAAKGSARTKPAIA
jgi:nucleotide-binding universal stress UspA family protein